MSAAHSAGTSAPASALLASPTGPPGCSGSSSGRVFLAGGGSRHFRGWEKPGREGQTTCDALEGPGREGPGRVQVCAEQGSGLYICSLSSDSLQPAGLLCPWDPPGKNTGVGCHFLLQGIILIQGLNLYLLH